MVTKRGRRRQLSRVVLATAVCACSGGGGDATLERPPARAAKPVDVRDVAFAPALAVSFDAMTRLPGGVYIHEVQTGRGATAAPGQLVTVEYRAWLPDGTLYDERPKAGGWGAAEFTLGEGSPVPGLTEGIDGMRVGGVRRIVIPAEQGYGLIGRPEEVPENSALLFEVRLLKTSTD